MNETTAILQLMLTRGIGRRTLRRILSKLADRDIKATQFVCLDAEALVQEFGLRPESAETIPCMEKDAILTYEALAAQDVRLLALGDHGYPGLLEAILQDDAPPVLFAKGNIDILHRPSVGFCGSRKASDKGLGVARDCAALLAGHGINIVSGHANGVDLEAHSSALTAGGVTTIVLAEGILNFSPGSRLRSLIRDDNYLVLSEFMPRSRWFARQAMQRNSTICGLAGAVIVVESGLKGGTFNAGTTALELKRPLFVVEYGSPAPTAAGNAYFLNRGAQSLRRTREGAPNVTKVLIALKRSGLPPKQGVLAPVREFAST